MTDLLDIAPATAFDVVRITGNKRVKVRGLHGNDIAAIAARFPNLIALFAAAGDNLVLLMSSFGPAIGPVIAAGCDQLGDEKQEAAASRLLVEDQIKLVKAIMGLTFPNGIGSFMETITALMTGPGESAKPVRIRSRKLPSASPPSSETDSHPTMQ
jgi:hypothetical protein